jgi:hypothetical protein
MLKWTFPLREASWPRVMRICSTISLAGHEGVPRLEARPV